jgi:hypothetical protein
LPRFLSTTFLFLFGVESEQLFYAEKKNQEGIINFLLFLTSLQPEPWEQTGKDEA